MAAPIRRTLTLLVPLLLGALLAGCRIDVDDMNDSGYRALAFELPDKALEFFGAARELIVEEVGPDGDPRTHPQYPRMRRGELLVAAWTEPDTALGELATTAAERPDLFAPEDWVEQVETYTLAGRPAEALAIARWASAAHPEEEALRRQRDNLSQLVDAEAQVPEFDPSRG
jgi:hypothetical protein